ncbi:MAG: hypothetical protein V4773_24905 [Verrucomicrobiota bacterium]
MPLPPPSLFRVLFGSTAALVLLTSCTVPKASFRKVDETSPEFRAAVARETQQLQSADQPVADAAKVAAQRVKAQFVTAEKERRTAQVAPLVEVMAALEKPRGCWAYTATRTKTVDGVPTVTIETFDPFQSEERLWTLVSRNGQPPDAKAQADYREERLRKWKKSLNKKSRHSDAEFMARFARLADFEVTAPDDSAHTTYTFGRERTKVPLVGDTGAYRQTFVVDRTRQSLQQRTMELQSPASALAGSFKVDRLHSTADYTVIEPALPPFVTKTAVRYRAHVFGNDTGDIVEETVYSDYRRVKCYDDRFEVKIGVPQVSDLLPE